MGVYIKSMEMPDSCRKCELFIDCDNCDGWETMCAILGPIGYLNEIPNDFRHQNCPLVEVKTPHGRLIDADALDLHDEEERAHNEVVEVARESGCGSPTHLYYSAFYEGLLTITSKIRFAPTTIEAEAKT